MPNKKRLIECLHTSYIRPSYIRPGHWGVLWLHTDSHKTAHFFLMNKRTFSHFNEAYRHEHHSKKISKMPQNLITTDASWCEPQNLLSTLFFFSIFVWKLMQPWLHASQFQRIQLRCVNCADSKTRNDVWCFFMLFQEILECKLKQLKSLLWPICVKQQIFQKRLFLGISSQLWAF